MCWRKPVIVFQADGVERDLIKHQETGIRLDDGSMKSFQQSIEKLMQAPEGTKSMGEAAFKQLNESMTTEHMIEAIFSYVLNVLD